MQYNRINNIIKIIIIIVVLNAVIITLEFVYNDHPWDQQ